MSTSTPIFLFPNWITCSDGQVTGGLVFYRHFLSPLLVCLVAAFGLTSPASLGGGFPNGIPLA